MSQPHSIASSKASWPSAGRSLPSGLATCIAALRRYETVTVPRRQQRLSRHPASPNSKPPFAGTYLQVRFHRRTYSVHRLVLSVALGRTLAYDEHVHHRNGDTHDNRLANLQLLSASQHTSLTHRKGPLVSY